MVDGVVLEIARVHKTQPLLPDAQDFTGLIHLGATDLRQVGQHRLVISKFGIEDIASLASGAGDHQDVDTFAHITCRARCAFAGLVVGMRVNGHEASRRPLRSSRRLRGRHGRNPKGPTMAPCPTPPSLPSSLTPEQQALLKRRYGSRRTRSWPLVAAVAVTAVLFVGWVIWAGWGQADQQVRWRTVGYVDICRQLSDGRI